MRRLLFITSQLPSVSGNGLSMRAGAVLTELCKQYDVWVLAVPLWGGDQLASMPQDLRAACRAVRVIEGDVAGQPVVAGSPQSIATAAEAFVGQVFDVVHVFKLSMIAYARSYMAPSGGHRPQSHIDIDDVESVALARIAQRARENADEMGYAEHHEKLAKQAIVDEENALRLFDRIYVCSEEDRSLLIGRGRAPGSVKVLRNTVEIPSVIHPLPTTGSFRFLFVGTLVYYPNIDGLLHFAAQILPRLRKYASRPFEVEVAGRGQLHPRLEVALQEKEFLFSGAVPSVAPLYERASAVIVPILSGGGTRIKAIEAFAHQRPVVTTVTGVEGIPVRDQEHVLLSNDDDPETFARHCALLMSDSELASRLVRNAFEFARESCSPAARAAAVALDSPSEDV